jgi:hypothetical protein
VVVDHPAIRYARLVVVGNQDKQTASYGVLIDGVQVVTVAGVRHVQRIYTESAGAVPGIRELIARGCRCDFEVVHIGWGSDGYIGGLTGVGELNDSRHAEMARDVPHRHVVWGAIKKGREQSLYAVVLKGPPIRLEARPDKAYGCRNKRSAGGGVVEANARLNVATEEHCGLGRVRRGANSRKLPDQSGGGCG